MQDHCIININTILKAKFNFTKTISFTFFILLFTVLISTIVIGGDALGGKIEKDRYFVWDSIRKTNDHGEKLYLEVSKYTYYFNLSMNYLFFIAIPFFLFIKIKESFSKSNKKKSN
jgi:hypothetical protein